MSIEERDNNVKHNEIVNRVKNNNIDKWVKIVKRFKTDKNQKSQKPKDAIEREIKKKKQTCWKSRGSKMTRVNRVKWNNSVIRVEIFKKFKNQKRLKVSNSQKRRV